MKKRVALDFEEEEEKYPPKRGKQKVIHGIFNQHLIHILKVVKTGVDNTKYTGKRPSATAVAAISQANVLDDIAEREAVYNKLRPEMQQQFKQEAHDI